MTPERASLLSNDQVCERFFSPFSSETTRSVLNDEGNNRKLDCSLVESEMRNRWRSALRAAGDQLQQPQPGPSGTAPTVHPSYQTTCVRTYNGGLSCLTQ